MRGNNVLRISAIVLGAILLVVPIVCLAQGFNWDQFLPGLQEPFGTDTLLDVVSTIINLAFAVAGIVAVIYLIIGGFNYVTAGGNPETVEAAKTTIVNAIIGLIVILISYLIIQFVMSQIGAEPELPEPEG